MEHVSERLSELVSGESSKSIFAVNRQPTYQLLTYLPTYLPLVPRLPGSTSLPSKQPLKLPTTKNDLAATQELPDPFLSAFSRSFSSNDVWINYRHCRHRNCNHLKILPDAIIIISSIINSFQMELHAASSERMQLEMVWPGWAVVGNGS